MSGWVTTAAAHQNCLRHHGQLLFSCSCFHFPLLKYCTCGSHSPQSHTLLILSRSTCPLLWLPNLVLDVANGFFKLAHRGPSLVFYKHRNKLWVWIPLHTEDIEVIGAVVRRLVMYRLCRVVSFSSPFETKGTRDKVWGMNFALCLSARNNAAKISHVWISSLLHTAEELRNTSWTNLSWLGCVNRRERDC